MDIHFSALPFALKPFGDIFESHIGCLWCKQSSIYRFGHRINNIFISPNAFHNNLLLSAELANDVILPLHMLYLNVTVVLFGMRASTIGKEPSLMMKSLIYLASFKASEAATTYSVSHAKSTMHYCFTLDQLTIPPFRVKICPDVDALLSRSDWKSTSVYPINCGFPSPRLKHNLYCTWGTLRYVSQLSSRPFLGCYRIVNQVQSKADI